MQKSPALRFRKLTIDRLAPDQIDEMWELYVHSRFWYWTDRWFGWMVPAMGGSQNLKMWHDFGMWLFVMFAILHIYMAIRADAMGRQSSIGTIVNGWRRYKD